MSSVPQTPEERLQYFADSKTTGCMPPEFRKKPIRPKKNPQEPRRISDPRSLIEDLDAAACTTRLNSIYLEEQLPPA